MVLGSRRIDVLPFMLTATIVSLSPENRELTSALPLFFGPALQIFRVSRPAPHRLVARLRQRDRARRRLGVGIPSIPAAGVLGVKLVEVVR
jgi:hypothetical protein